MFANMVKGDAFRSQFDSVITTRSQGKIWLVKAPASTVIQCNKLLLLRDALSVYFNHQQKSKQTLKQGTSAAVFQVMKV